jgi:hypothetical protein
MLSETKSRFEAKTSIFIAIVFAGLLVAGCSTTTYLSLTENNKEQIEQKLSYDERDKDVGAEVTLLLKDRTEINGELLSVRDSAITICTEYSATEEELANLKYPINTVRDDEIKELSLEGSNHVWTGLAVGIVVGTGLGVLAGSLVDKHKAEFRAGLGAIGFIVGAIAGPIVGHALSTEEFVLQEIPPGYDFSLLKPLSRYPVEEPEYLREIK